MHNKPHTTEAKQKMSLARSGVKVKYGHLPELEIVTLLLTTSETMRSLSIKYGCSDSTIKLILRRHTTKEQRLDLKAKKQAKTLKATGAGSKHIGELAKKLKVWHGRKHKPESKQKQSAAKKGKKLSIERCIKYSATKQGIELSDWCGFATTEKQRQRSSMELKDWRSKVFERDNYACQLCGKRGGRLHPHHIKPFAKYPKLRFEVSNGVTLCDSPCHKQTIMKEHLFEDIFYQLQISKTGTF